VLDAGLGKGLGLATRNAREEVKSSIWLTIGVSTLSPVPRSLSGPVHGQWQAFREFAGKLARRGYRDHWRSANLWDYNKNAIFCQSNFDDCLLAVGGAWFEFPETISFATGT
jgi:hypothetical protein